MTSCEHIERELSAYRDGELTVAQREAFEAHLDECVACRDSFGSWDDALTDLAELGGFPVPDDFEDLVLARLEPEEAAASARKAWWPLVVTAAAASLLTAWLVSLLRSGDDSREPDLRVRSARTDSVRVEAIVGKAEVLDRDSGSWRPLSSGMELPAPAVVRGSQHDTTVEISELGSLTVPAGRLAWIGGKEGRLLPADQGSLEGTGRADRSLSHQPLERPFAESGEPRGGQLDEEDSTAPIGAMSVSTFQRLIENGLDWQRSLVEGQSRWWGEMSGLAAEGARWTRAATDLLRAEIEAQEHRRGESEPIASEGSPDRNAPVAGPPRVAEASDAQASPARRESRGSIVALPPGFRIPARPEETLTVLRRRGEVELVTRGSYSQRIPLLLDVLETEPTLRDLARVQLEEILGDLERNREYRAGEPEPFPSSPRPTAVEWLTDGPVLPPALQPDPDRGEEQDHVRRWQEWWRSNRDLVARVDETPSEFF